MKKFGFLAASAIFSALFVFGAANAADGFKVGVGVNNTDAKYVIKDVDHYAGTDYSYQNENTVNTLLVGPVAKYQQSIYDFGNNVNLGAGIYIAYYFPLIGSHSLGGNETLKLGNSAEAGLDLLLQGDLWGVPSYAGVRAGWSYYSISDSYSGTWQSWHKSHFAGLSIGPVFGFDVADHWTVEGSVLFGNAQSGHDSGKGPDEIWDYTKNVRTISAGAVFLYRI